jgi:hypothetical protein
MVVRFMRMIADGGLTFSMFMGVGVLMAVVVMMFRVGMVMPGVVSVDVVMLGVVRREFRIARLFGLRRIEGRAFDYVALHAFAAAAAARIAVPRALAAAGTVVGFFLGFAVRALVGLDQRLTVGDRDLVIIGMDFAEGQEAVAVAAVFDEGGLQRRLDPRDLGEIDVAAELLALRGFEIKLFDAIAANHDNPGLFRVGRVDQHFVWHLGAHDGGGRAWRQAHVAQPGDATVHLIRG